MSDVMIIGIAGGTCSGKTTLSERLAEHFHGETAILRHDSYYKAYDELSYEERAKLNYDHPDAFDTDLLVKHLDRLKNGEAVDSPVYDFKIYNRSDKTEHILPKKVIIVEGILIFENKELCDRMDIKIFVDTDSDVRIIRRIRRDAIDRARSLDSIIDQYLSTVKPMHDRFVEPSKKNADLVVLNGAHNLVALDMIIHSIEQHLQ